MERLTSDALMREQERTLSTPRLHYSLLARVLFVGMDMLYGRRRTLSKFKVLELIARVPYQAWEQVAYVAMTTPHAIQASRAACSTESARADSSRTTSSGIC